MYFQLKPHLQAEVLNLLLEDHMVNDSQRAQLK